MVWVFSFGFSLSCLVFLVFSSSYGEERFVVARNETRPWVLFSFWVLAGGSEVGRGLESVGQPRAISSADWVSPSS